VKRAILIILLAALLIGAMQTAQAMIDTPVCTDTSDQRSPVISGNIIVWIDWRNYANTGSDIYMYDLGHPEKGDQPVCTEPGDQSLVNIDGNIIVWADDRDVTETGTDIYMYDLNDPVPNGRAICKAPGSQEGPVVDGNIIVWKDWRNYANTGTDIYMYDLGHPEKGDQPVCTEPGDQTAPVVDGNIIVWTDDRNLMVTGYDIYMYDLNDPVPNGLAICTEPGDQVAPVVDGNIIVWTDRRDFMNTGWDIYMYDLNDPVSNGRAVCNVPGGQDYAAVDGNIIVWADNRKYREMGADIYMYDLNDPVPNGRAVCTEPGGQGVPVVDGNIIVWVDDRNLGEIGDDIYMYDLGHPELGDQRVCTAPGEQGVPRIDGNVIVWEDERSLTNEDIYMAVYMPDTFAPVTTAVYDPSAPDGDNGWYEGDVTITLSPTDQDDAPADITTYYTLDGSTKTYTAPFKITGDGTHTLTYHSEDPAGNKGADTTTTINIDATQPEVSISTPLDSAIYTLGRSVLADWAVTDTTSGVASSIYTQSSGSAIDTSTAGPKEFTVTATDNAGNTNAVTYHYTVAYAYTPVTPFSTKVTQMKLGSSLPIKIVLKDSGGNLITDAAVQLYLAKQTGSDWVEQKASSLSNPKDSNVLRYDPLTGQYKYNLDTKPLSTGTWQLRIRAGDGITQTMTIKIIK
jgi:beta propeller repeat protein